MRMNISVLLIHVTATYQLVDDILFFFPKTEVSPVQLSSAWPSVLRRVPNSNPQAPKTSMETRKKRAALHAQTSYCIRISSSVYRFHNTSTAWQLTANLHVQERACILSLTLQFLVRQLLGVTNGLAASSWYSKMCGLMFQALHGSSWCGGPFRTWSSTSPPLFSARASQPRLALRVSLTSLPLKINYI